MTPRNTFTRDEVERVLREALFDITMGGARSLLAQGERKTADVLQRMALRIKRDDELVLHLFEMAEQKAELPPLLSVVPPEESVQDACVRLAKLVDTTAAAAPVIVSGPNGDTEER